MLYTKPQGHWPFGSGEEDFWRVFTIYGHGSHLGHVTQTQQTNFRSPIPLRLHMKFGFDWPSGFGENDLWKWWTDDGPWLYSGELTSHFQNYTGCVTRGRGVGVEDMIFIEFNWCRSHPFVKQIYFRGLWFSGYCYMHTSHIFACLSHILIYCWPFQGGASVVVHQCLFCPQLKPAVLGR